jgi:uncharacterized repeat protein (TIGR03803 family)
MKKVLPIIASGVLWLMLLNARAETPQGTSVSLTVLSSFAGDSSPNDVVRGKDGNVYGTTQFGGDYGYGAVFVVTPSGVMTNLYEFGSDPDVDLGAGDPGNLIQATDGNLYGTTQNGGDNESGTVFRISTTGALKVVYSFGAEQDAGSSYPVAALVQGSDSYLYGTAEYGGAYDNGTIFKIGTNGDFSLLHSFSEILVDGKTILQGADPVSPMIQAVDGNFYGVAPYGGVGGGGTIFQISSSGNFSNLYSFGATPGDGSMPTGLTQDADGSFYGVTQMGGVSSNGVLFHLSTNFTLTNIYSFDEQSDVGFSPIGALVPTGGKFYGATQQGGTNQDGSIFAFDAGGAPASVVLFNSDTGYSPQQSQCLTLGADGNLYGATSAGGTNGDGTVYQVVLPSGAAPQISIEPVSHRAVAGGSFTLQVAATGSDPLVYQWRFDGSSISGATTTNLTVQNVTATNAGSYTVVVSNYFGSVTSMTAQITVIVEKTKPLVTITSPKAGSHSMAPVLSGTASDAVELQNVTYWITNKNNGVTTTLSGQATLAAGLRSVSNWTIQTTLLPGTNILALQSSNYANLGSAVAHTAFFYQVTAPLQLLASPTGLGKITGVTNDANLYIGERYTVTAKPAFNCWLTNWSENGSVVGSNETLTFIMESNLTVTANFASNLFVGMAGRYDGIFFPSYAEGATEETSGLIENLLLKTNGIYSGKMYLAGSAYSLAGAFDRAGNATERITGGKVILQMNIPWQTSPRQINGLVQGDSGGWISSNLNLYAAATNLGNFPAYTLLLAQDTNISGAPPSYGYAVVTNTGRMVKITGILSDGTPFSRSEPINDQNEFPVYANLYGGKGLLLGQLSLSAGIFGAVPAGNVTWIKPLSATGLYKSGFTTALGVEGSPWTNSAAALAALFTTNAQLVISGGGLASNVVCAVRLTSTDTLQLVSGSPRFSSGSVNRVNGEFKVLFLNAAGKKVTAYGTILQNTNLGGGFFLGTTEAGTITLTLP